MSDDGASVNAEAKLMLEERRVLIAEEQHELAKAEKARERKERIRAKMAAVRRTDAVKKAIAQQMALPRDLRQRRPAASASGRVAEIAHAFFGGATQVIQHALEDGDVKVAMFVAGRYLDAARQHVAVDLTLPENPTPMDIANATMLAVAEGRLPIDQAERMMRICTAAAGLNFQEQLDDLKAMVASLGGDAKVIEGGAEHIPTWVPPAMASLAVGKSPVAATPAGGVTSATDNAGSE